MVLPALAELAWRVLCTARCRLPTDVLAAITLQVLCGGMGIPKRLMPAKRVAGARWSELLPDYFFTPAPSLPPREVIHGRATGFAKSPICQRFFPAHAPLEQTPWPIWSCNNAGPVSGPGALVSFLGVLECLCRTAWA